MKRRFGQLVVCLLALAPAYAQSPLTPLPGETLRQFQTRMEAYFAPVIAQGGGGEEGSEYSAFQRFVQMWKARMEPDTTFEEVAAREAAFYRRAPRRRTVRSLDNSEVSATATAGATWRELGPNRKSNTTSTPGGHDNASGIGPIEFLTFYEPLPKYMLCGSLAGGLFYSTDGAETWSSTGTDTEIGQSGVSSAVFKPDDHTTWFVASGGNSTTNEPWYIGAGGVFRTRDEGKTWTQIADGLDLRGTGTKIYKLVINPKNPKQLWIATSNGVFVTEDACGTAVKWTSLANLHDKFVYDFELRPEDPQWMYAAAADCPDQCFTWRFHFSSDGGQSWNEVPQPPSTMSATFATIEVSPVAPENLYCQVVVNGKYSSALSIYNFNLQARLEVANDLLVEHGQGHAFTVDNSRPYDIYVGYGINARRYTNSGTSWSIADFEGGTFHDDVEDIVAHPVRENEVWMTHHGGVSVSTDRGLTWSDRSNGIGSAMIWSMATANDPEHIAMALYHDGTVITTPATGGWRLGLGGDGLLPLVDPIDPHYMWASHQGYYSPDRWYRTTKHGAMFQPNPPDSPAAWNTAAVLNRVDPRLQYRWARDGAGRAAVIRSIDRFNDNGDAVFYPPFPLRKLFTAETSRGYLIASVTDGARYRLFRTKVADHAEAATVRGSWHELPAPVIRPEDVEFDLANPDVVYITTQDQVYRADYTTPAAPRFTDITQNLTNLVIGGGQALSAERTNGGLYLVADQGCWYSNDATRATGAGWCASAAACPRRASRA